MRKLTKRSDSAHFFTLRYVHFLNAKFDEAGPSADGRENGVEYVAVNSDPFVGIIKSGLLRKKGLLPFNLDGNPLLVYFGLYEL